MPRPNPSHSHRYLHSAAFAATVLFAGPAAAEIEVRFDVDIAKDIRHISPLVYGANGGVGAGDGVTFFRSGGNRLSGYNWENNASHAGTDWQNSSDSYLSNSAAPGKVITDFHDANLKVGAHSLITMPAAGYVSKDKNGTVSQAETAPSARWAKVVHEKGAPFTATPDVADANVYSDELVDFLVKKYGSSATDNGIKHYSIDNEPGLWPSTHPRIHPDKTGAVELVQKTVGLAAAIKKGDPQGEIFGGVFYGYNDFASLQDAPDWPAIKKQSEDAGRPYAWYLDYFLEEMKKASDAAGKRLLDVLDIHWYSEANGDARITEAAATSAKDREARVQAPRSLWDSAYTETSWISKWATPKQPVTNWADPAPGPILLLPRLFASIAKYFPGTRLAITEFNYGGGNHVTGGLATADFLGIAGRHGVHATHYWPLEETSVFAATAYRLFRNYDGKGGAFPSSSPQALSANRDAASIYAAFRSGGDALHVIVINKHATEALKADIRVATPVALVSAEVFGFGGDASALSEKAPVASIAGNAFTYNVPAWSAYHLVIKTAGPLPASIRFPGLRPLAGRIPGWDLGRFRADGRSVSQGQGATLSKVRPVP